MEFSLPPGGASAFLDANPERVTRCERKLKLNGLSAETFCCAVGSTTEVRQFHVPSQRPSYASFGSLDYPCETMEVPVRRLDELLPEKGVTEVDFLKIDVEGFEPEVLNGLGNFPYDPRGAVADLVLARALESSR